MTAVIILGFPPGKKMEVNIFPVGNCLFPCGVDFPPFLIPQVPSLPQKALGIVRGWASQERRRGLGPA